MSAKSKIQWTDATWNPVVGCSPASPGCDNCYASRMAHRLGKNPATPQYAGLTEGGVWTGETRLVEKALLQPLGWKKGRRVFVCSMGDLFHESVPFEWVDKVFSVMALASQHTFMVLTKRPEQMREYLRRYDGVPTALTWPYPNIWLGVTAENQAMADARIPILLDTPAAKRFVSVEPMLGPVNLEPWLEDACDSCDECRSDCHIHKTVYRDSKHLLDPEQPAFGYHPEIVCLDWVICGGGTGPGARPMHPDWPRGLHDQCAAARVAFFFKQWGEWAPWDDDNWSLPSGADDMVARDKSRMVGGIEFLKVGSSRAGRLLDGREHNDIPEVQS